MNFLEERIVKDGIVKPGNVLKVDSFLNHQMDIALMEEIGREFKRRFGHKTITKVMTIEASGIGIAAFVAKEFGVPMVFAKKSKSINIDGDMYVAEVESFTHRNKNQVIVSKRFLHEGEHVLVIDDFLANGCALQGICRCCCGRLRHRHRKGFPDRRPCDPQSWLSCRVFGNRGCNGRRNRHHYFQRAKLTAPTASPRR